VLEHGFSPAPDNFLELKDKEKIRIVYSSTPQRGLEILVPVFKKLAEIHPDIHLEVYSSFKIYGWDDADKQYESLYNEIQNHPQMTYHGFVPHDELRSQLNKCHIHAYPSIWMETACRAVIEAMSAGLVCVHPNYGALTDTSAGLNVMYQGDYENKNNHASIFANYLNSTINMVRNNDHTSIVQFNKIFADSRFNINRIKSGWETMLKELLEQYPTVESRGKPKQMFRYRT
jgi:glycosyltransferase involved in cell wall biosynthesis